MSASLYRTEPTAVHVKRVRACKGKREAPFKLSIESLHPTTFNSARDPHQEDLVEIALSTQAGDPHQSGPLSRAVSQRGPSSLDLLRIKWTLGA